MNDDHDLPEDENTPDVLPLPIGPSAAELTEAVAGVPPEFAANVDAFLAKLDEAPPDIVIESCTAAEAEIEGVLSELSLWPQRMMVMLESAQLPFTGELTTAVVCAAIAIGGRSLAGRVCGAMRTHIPSDADGRYLNALAKNDPKAIGTEIARRVEMRHAVLTGMTRAARTERLFEEALVRIREIRARAEARREKS